MKITSSQAGLSVFDAEVMTNIFLWGESELPTQLYDRVKSKEYVASLPTAVVTEDGVQRDVKVIELQINGRDMMSDGAGRFIKASQFDIVQDFFEFSGTEAGRYSYAEMVQALNEQRLFNGDYPDNITESHSRRSDDEDLTAERSYIFENSAYLLGSRPKAEDDMVFVVAEDGTKHIENLQIRPFNDNFDFEGGSLLSDIFNSFVGDTVDPYGIGTRVDIVYDNSDIDVTAMYTLEQYEADQAYVSDTSSFLPDSEGKSEVETKYESAADYEIDEYSIYVGTHEIDEAVSGDAVGGSNSPVLMLLGDDNDTGLGGDLDDRLYGHAGNDDLRGGDGDDRVFGGSGNDVIFGGEGADRLFGDNSSENYNGAEEPVVTSGNDNIDGGAGNDFLDSGFGADVLDGGDEASDRPGDDQLEGGAGADVLIYRWGTDVLNGGLGNDYYDFTEATGRDAVVVLEEGFGRDVFSSNYSAVDRVVFEGLSSSDVTFAWDYTVQTFDQGFFTSQFYDGAATITVNATGDSLYLGNVGGQVDFDRFGLLNSFIQSFFAFEFTDGVFGNWNSLFGRPDQITSQAVDPDANTALQDHEDERAEDPDPDPDTETETREFDDGRVLVSQLVDGVKVSATMTDVADAYVWTSYVDSFDAAEERVSRSLSYDDGRTAETTYTDGVRSTNIITDAADAFVWASLDQTFDASGVRAAQTNTYDDGRVLETLYVDGIRSTATMTDVEDAYNWAGYVDTYDDAGDRVSRSLEYDDGRTAETTYTNGVRSTNIITDAADEFVWATIDQTFDASGVRTAQTNSYDDGRILETLYADGVRSTATMTDVEDAYNWASYVDVFDDVGDRISRTFTNDDGFEFFI